MSENIGTNNNRIKTHINIHNRQLHIYNHGVFVSSQCHKPQITLKTLQNDTRLNNNHGQMIGLYGTYYASTNGRLLKNCLLNKHWSKKCRCPKTKEKKNIRNFHMSET